LSKEFGRIVDYVGIFQNYKEALNYDPEDIGEFEDVESLVLTFPKVLNEAFEPFEDIKLEDTYECAMNIIRKLSELDHGKFENSFREVVQLWESISPHPKLREHREKYLWLNKIYEIYLEEFKRQDFDAEIYAAKTQRLIQESAKLINFKGHLPSINIDSDYLNKLKETKLSPSDKAEKIIRDIETVIRQNEVNSAIYIEFQNRLDDLIKRKQEQSLAIEEILNQLSALYTELDDVASMPQRMGFPDKGSFEIYTLIKNISKAEFIDEMARDFAITALENIIRKKIYIGWQDVPREYERLQSDIELLAVNPKFEALKIDEQDELIERIMKAILQNYTLN